MTALSQALASVADTTDRLTGLSRRHFQNPYTTVEWPARLDPDRDWFTAPELLSLHGTAEGDALDVAARRRLAFLEAANFFSLNIHGEKGLMQGLAARLYRSDLLEVADYLHHFLDEENKHSVYFGGFCTRYAKVYRTRQVALPSPDRPRDVEDLLFFAETMVFEEIVDHYNRVQARDVRLHPLARFINHSHHLEEARHLIFGRRLVAALWQRCAADWPQSTMTDVREHLAAFITATWRDYYNPDVYADAGFTDPWGLAERAWAAPAQRAHRRAVSARWLDHLTSVGILTKEPDDAF